MYGFSPLFYIVIDHPVYAALAIWALMVIRIIDKSIKGNW